MRVKFWQHLASFGQTWTMFDKSSFLSFGHIWPTSASLWPGSASRGRPQQLFASCWGNVLAIVRQLRSSPGSTGQLSGALGDSLFGNVGVSAILGLFRDAAVPKVAPRALPPLPRARPHIGCARGVALYRTSAVETVHGWLARSWMSGKLARNVASKAEIWTAFRFSGADLGSGTDVTGPVRNRLGTRELGSWTKVGAGNTECRPDPRL